MTSRDFIHAEAENRNRIILYREGLFWKAYERSAYIVCMRIAPFRPTKRNPKSLDGAEIVSIGFPWSHEEKYLGGLRRVEESADPAGAGGSGTDSAADFDIWKARLPLHVPSVRSKTADRAATGPVNPLTAEAASEIVAQRPEACALPAGKREPYRRQTPVPGGADIRHRALCGPCRSRARAAVQSGREYPDGVHAVHFRSEENASNPLKPWPITTTCRSIMRLTICCERFTEIRETFRAT